MAYESVPPADIVVCSHYCPVCVLSSCESGEGGCRGTESETTMQGLWEKRCMYGSKNTAESGAQGNEGREELMVSGWETAVGPLMRDTQHDN